MRSHLKRHCFLIKLPADYESVLYIYHVTLGMVTSLQVIRCPHHAQTEPQMIRPNYVPLKVQDYSNDQRLFSYIRSEPGVIINALPTPR